MNDFHWSSDKSNLNSGKCCFYCLTKVVTILRSLAVLRDTMTHTPTYIGISKHRKCKLLQSLTKNLYARVRLTITQLNNTKSFFSKIQFRLFVVVVIFTKLCTTTLSATKSLRNSSPTISNCLHNCSKGQPCPCAHKYLCTSTKRASSGELFSKYAHRKFAYEKHIANLF